MMNLFLEVLNDPLEQENNYANTETAAAINSNEVQIPNAVQIPNLIGRDKSKMPITNVTKIMRKFLPNTAKVSDGAKEMIQQSATNYITHVTRKAKEKCQSEYRKIMNADDLLWAIENVGFDEYIGPLSTFLQRCRHIEGGSSNGPAFGPTFEPELNPVEMPLNAVEMPHPPLPPPPPPPLPPPPPPAAEMFDPNGVSGFINFDPFSLFQQDQL